MAEKRLGANFSIDTSSLKAGLAAANRLIRESEAEFRAAAAGIDNWSKSEEGLTKRQKALTEQIGIQRQKISALVAEKQRIIDKLKAEGASDDDVAKATDSLNKQIAKESKQLDSLDRDLSQTNKSLKDLKSGNDAAEASAKKAGDGFTVLKGTLANLAASGFRAALSGAKKLASELVNLGQKADELNTISKQSGFSTDELQKFEYAAEMIDVDTNTIIGAARKMAKNLTSTSEQTIGAFNRLGVQIRDGNGELRDRNTVFYEVVSALGAVTNETERDTIAMQIFGKSADELAGLIDDGGAALREYGEEAERLGVIMSTDTVNGANAFNDAVDRIKATAKGAFSNIGGEIARYLAPEVDKLRGGFQKLIRGINWKSVVGKGVDLVKSFGKVLVDIGKTVIPPLYEALKFALDNFKVLAPTIMIAVGAIKAATIAQAALNSAMLANPIGAVISAVALLAGGIALLISTTNEQAEYFDALSERERAVVDGAKDAAEAFREQRDAAAQLAGGELENIEYTQRLWGELQTLVDENGNVISGYEGRAEFILGRLNEALGTEYKLNGNVVESYQEISKSIDDVIEKKKAQILLDAYAEDYATAVKNRAAAEEAAGAAAIGYARALEYQREESAKTQAKTAELKDQLKNGEIGILEYDAAIQKNSAHMTQVTEATGRAASEYLEAQRNLDAYTVAIEKYEDASSAAIEGNTAKAIDIMSGYAQAVAEAQEGIRQTDSEMLAAAEERVLSTETLLRMEREKYAEHEKELTEDEKKAWKNRIVELEKTAAAAKDRYVELGGNLVRGIAEGASEEGWLLSDVMNKIINQAVAEARRVAEIASPSKLFKRKIGLPIGQGLAVGIRESTGAVLSAARSQISDLEKVYSGQNVSAMNAGLRGSANEMVAAGRGVIVNQVNHYDQAHTRYELYENKQATIAGVKLALAAAGS